MADADDEVIAAVVDRLAGDGYAIVPNFVRPQDVAAMVDEIHQLENDPAFHRAGVGQGEALVLREDVRGDHVYWIDESVRNGAWSVYYDKLEALRQSVNRELMLGLFEYEGHYARYPAGAFYKRHLDQFRGDDRRRLTCVLYLNPGWEAADGGQLRMYLDEPESGRTLDVMPTAGTLLVFLSSRFWHEVLPARRERLSLTGWFKIRG